MRHAALAVMLVSMFAMAPAHAGGREELIVQNSTVVLRELQRMPDQGIPDWLLQRAKGIAILPTVVKVGLGLGGRGGSGVLHVRDEQGRWTNPSFIRIGGLSFGAQIGGQVTDLVLVFTTRQSIEGITDGQTTLGADASVAAGPVGRSASAATNFGLDKEVYSYSRSKGLFAGIALDGSVIGINRKANAAYYGRSGITVSDIFSGRVKAPDSGTRELLEELSRATAAPAPGSAPAAAPAATGEAASSTVAPAEEPGPAKTFPMEDPEPGAEPR